MKVCWNSCKENGRIWFSLRWRWVFTCVKSCCHQCETTVSHWWSNSIYRKFTHWHPIKLNESTAYPVRFNLISTLLLQITGECSTPSLTYRFGGITDFLHGKLLVMSGMKWRKNFIFYVRRSYLFIGLIMKGEPGLVSGTWWCCCWKYRRNLFCHVLYQPV